MTKHRKRVASGLAIAGLLVSSVAFGRREFRAPVTDSKGRLMIIEFSDYECPHCRAAQPALRSLLDHYGDKVVLVHKHYPLEMVHRWARAAAVAAVCAERQGKFEAFNAALFDRQDDWSKLEDPPQAFSRYARELGLDVDSFEACRRDPAVDARVTAERNEARALGVESTPTFFIGGERMAGARQLSYQGPRIIEKWLAKLK